MLLVAKSLRLHFVVTRSTLVTNKTINYILTNNMANIDSHHKAYGIQAMTAINLFQLRFVLDVFLF
jgi:hypothetical protein